MHNRRSIGLIALICLALLAPLAAKQSPARAADLEEIKRAGVLRHLGIPYANFVTGSGDGLDTDIIRLFAAHLGVRYQFVPTSWEQWPEDLIGRKVEVSGDEVRLLEPAPIRGDLIACGLTVLPWREKLIDFSQPTFPTQVWLLTRADSPVRPILPSPDQRRDIETVTSLLTGHTIKEVLGKKGTCLDPELYDLYRKGATCKVAPELNLNELAPALLAGEAEAILLDVPDALIALQKWTGQLKVIGPISEQQFMSAGFPKDSPKLRKAFDAFFSQLQASGTYMSLAMKYYPNARSYFPGFFHELSAQPARH